MSITGTIASRPAVSGGRESERRLLRLGTRGITAEGQAAAVLIHNLSATGLLLETSSDLPLGETLLVELPEIGETPAKVVWRSERLVGCAFADPLPQAALSAAQLRNPVRHDLDMDRLATAAPFGDRLRYLRERRGLSRAALAARTGLSAPTLWSWEAGRTQPRRKRLNAVAAALDVDLDDLLHGGKRSAEAESAGMQPGPAADAAAHVESVLRANKEAIALALGVRAERIRIVVEL